MKRVISLLFIIDVLLLSFVKFKAVEDEGEMNANKSFVMSFIKESVDDDENILISPYSVELALRMLMDGASGKTKEELMSVLGERVVSDVTSEKVLVSNGLFIKDVYENGIRSEFKNNILSNYGGEVLVDSFKTPDVINNWAKERTNGMIPEIMESVNPEFVLGIANALALDLEWYMPFSCESTRKGLFTRRDGSQYNVSMMHDNYDTEAYGYFDNKQEIGIVIPYNEVDGKEYEYIGILPNEDIKEYIDSFDLKRLLKTKKSASSDVQVFLSMPKFSYDYTLIDFKNILENMGLHKMFSESEAEFYNIISKDSLVRNNLDNLYVGEGIHKTHINLNEKGTKAAAVTFFGLFGNSALGENKYKSVYITFDRPFIYLIREVSSNEILFFGIVNEPNEWEGITCNE